ncbi:hypothetical protein V6N11_063348 [Hibiscus sabdariffa]|uniref:Uncharacterized protein n=1 Tax=Hibiscus sabdariffa TaxID=183260 RepID=A0ABR1ZN43_9ROSI
MRCKVVKLVVDVRNETISSLCFNSVLDNLMTIVANPRQFKIPDWFLNRMWMHRSSDFLKDEREKQHWTLKKHFKATPIRNKKQMQIDLLEL